MKRLGVLFLLVFALFGCSSAFNDHVVEGDAFLEAGKFDLALKSYEMALEEKADNAEVKEKMALLEKYEELDKLIKDRKLADAEKLAEELLANENMVDSLTEAVEGLVEKIEIAQAENEEVDGELDEVEKLLEKKDVKEAKLLLKEIEKDRDVTHDKKRVDKLTDAIDKAEKREKEKKAKDKAEQEKVAKANAEKEKVAEEKQQPSGSYQEYIQKYEDTDAYVNAHLSKNTDADPYSHSAHAVGKWDDLLNEVWGVLKNEMPSGQFETLKAEQINWINEKEKRVDEIMDPNGGSIVRLEAMGYTMTVTQERTKYLIDNYMK